MIEHFLKNQLRDDTQLGEMLAIFNGKPAIFHKNVPPDTSRYWDQKPCYPRIDYIIDMREDPERKTSGVLQLNIVCTLENQVMPEDIEPHLIRLISGTFYTTDASTVCAIWNRSTSFESVRQKVADKEEFLIVGMTMEFDITSFPFQITIDPDPVLAINQWTKNNTENAMIIGQDALPEVFKPSDECPAIYWRLLGLSASDKSSFAVTWYECQLACHVITDSLTKRSKWLKAIMQKLGIFQEVLMSDDSPMFINKSQIRSDADQLREGQLVIFATFGVLNTPQKVPPAPKLMHAYFTLERGGKRVKFKKNADGFNQSKPLHFKRTFKSGKDAGCSC